MVNKAPQSKIEWRVISDSSLLEELAPEWENLAKSNNYSPFSTPSWLLPWIKVYFQNDWQLQVVAGFFDDQLEVIAPFYTRTEGEYLKYTRLMLIGQGEPESSEVMSEFQDIIISEKFKKTLAQEIIHQIRTLPFDHFHCHSILESSNLLYILRQTSDLDAKEVGKRYYVSDSKGLIQKVSRNTTSKWKRNLNRLSQHNFTFKWVDPKDFRIFWSLLKEYHQIRWENKGKLGAFSHEDFLNFHLKVIKQFEQIKISTLIVNDTPIAINYYINDNHTLYFYQCGWKEDNNLKIAPGFCLHMWSMLNNPLPTYDFMEGKPNDMFKSKFCEKDLPATFLINCKNSKLVTIKIYVNKLLSVLKKLKAKK